VRYLLLAVGVLLFSDAASAGWDEVMDVLERASGPRYDIGGDPSGREWVATREARFESERARTLVAERRPANLRDRSACPEPALGDQILRCD